MTDSVTKKGCPKIHIDTSFLCEPVRSQEGERRSMKRLTEKNKQGNWALTGNHFRIHTRKTNK